MPLYSINLLESLCHAIFPMLIIWPARVLDWSLPNTPPVSRFARNKQLSPSRLAYRLS